MQESNDGLDEMWGYDTVMMRHRENLACRPLHSENPDVCLNRECVEDEEAGGFAVRRIRLKACS